MPYAQLLEQDIVPGPDTIIKSVKSIMQGVMLWSYSLIISFKNNKKDGYHKFLLYLAL